jgi:predicted GNAT family acetyltransferase
MSPFCGIDASTPESWQGLLDLVGVGRTVVFVRVGELEWTPPDWAQVFHEVGTQYICEAPPSLESVGADTLAIVELDESDAEAMLELTALTKPGPFLPRTHEMGHYIGVRNDDRLVAMAGERVRSDAFSEISAVCVHPDARRQGLAAKLTTILAHEIRERGQTAILHVREGNDAAHAVYQGIGFVPNGDMDFSAWRHNGDPDDQ